jgi:hypothetical protein
MHLLSKGDSNTKLRKSNGQGYLLFGLSLLPADASGYNVCSHSTDGCRGACVLMFAGRSNMPSVRKARKRKTIMLFENRALFLAYLHEDLYAAERAAERAGLVCAVRLNVASDIVWEVIDPTLFSLHRKIEYYDYSKIPARCARPLPDNYALTYSHNEKTNADWLADILANGVNVAVVFDTVYNPSRGKVGKLPETWSFETVNSGSYTFKRRGTKTYNVIDGDTHDLRLREFDGTGNVIGLRGKGGKRIVREGVSKGFILPTIGGVASVA